MGHGKQSGNVMSEQAALAYFMSQGWTREQAAGIVGNLHYESDGLNPYAKGDYMNGEYTAFGLAQWRGDRVSLFQRIFGKSIKTATFEEQLKFVQYELTNNESAAGQALKKAKTVDEATRVFMEKYERPSVAASKNSLSKRIAAANSASVNTPDSVLSTVLGHIADIFKGPFLGGDSIIGKGQELITGENTFDDWTDILTGEFWKKNGAVILVAIVGGGVILMGVYQLVKAPVDSAIGAATNTAVKFAKAK